MRKAMLFFSLLLAIGIAAAAYGISAVYSARDQIEFTQTVVAGDASAANNLTIQTHMAYRDRLFWDSTTRVEEGMPHTKTEYRFFQSEQDKPFIEEYAGIALFNRYGVIFEQIETEGGTGLALAYQELYKSAVSGKEIQKTIRLADYYTYYPIEGYVSLKGINEDFMLWDSVEPDSATWRKLQDFFRIPVLQDEQLTISLQKDSDGHVFSTGSSSEGTQFNFYTQNVVTPETCYFTFYNFSSDGTMMDTSQIPGGYGIYALDYTAGGQSSDQTSTSENDGRLYLDSLRLVYPIDPQEEFLQLNKWIDGETLLLYTRKDGTYYLTSISMETMQQIQRIPIQSTANTSGSWTMLEGNGFIVCFVDCSATVLLPDENGKLYIDMQTKELAELSELLLWSLDENTMDYQNGKLALVFHQEYSEPSFDSIILDQDGVQLWAQYDSNFRDEIIDYIRCDSSVQF